MPPIEPNHPGLAVRRALGAALTALETRRWVQVAALAVLALGVANIAADVRDAEPPARTATAPGA